MRKALLFIYLVFLVSCTNDLSERLLGSWQAVQFFEQDSLIEIDLQRVQLQFDENGHYCFTSNLKHEECGHYNLQKNILSLQDTLSSDSPAKKIAIDFLYKDSLNIRMTEGKKTQNLLFQRVDQQQGIK